jgi:helix-turn-helix protein
MSLCHTSTAAGGPLLLVRFISSQVGLRAGSGSSANKLRGSTRQMWPSTLTTISRPASSTRSALEHTPRRVGCHPDAFLQSWWERWEMTMSEHKRDAFDLLTVPEVAAELRCSESTVRRAIRENRIPGSS